MDYLVLAGCGLTRSDAAKVLPPVLLVCQRGCKRSANPLQYVVSMGMWFMLGYSMWNLCLFASSQSCNKITTLHTACTRKASMSEGNIATHCKWLTISCSHIPKLIFDKSFCLIIETYTGKLSITQCCPTASPCGSPHGEWRFVKPSIYTPSLSCQPPWSYSHSQPNSWWNPWVHEASTDNTWSRKQPWQQNWSISTWPKHRYK